MQKVVLPVSILGIVIMSLAFIFRNTGIHIDENNYLSFVTGLISDPDNGMFGDARGYGKPYGFYLQNYFVFHYLGRLFGKYQAFSLHFFYIVLNVLGISWFCYCSAAGSVKRYSLMFISILLAPFVIFNGTQVMMETALLPLLCLVFGSLVAMDKSKPDTARLIIVCVTTIIALAIKETALPALFILFLTFIPVLRWKSLYFLTAIVCGLVFQKFMLWALSANPHNFGGISELVNLQHLPQKIDAVVDYCWMWVFYVGPIALVLILFTCLKINFPTTLFLHYRYIAVLLLSLASTLVILFAQDPNLGFLPRYSYPSIWLGLLATSILLFELLSLRWLPLIYMSYLLPLSNMWGGWGSQMEQWPAVVSKEVFFSGYTVFAGMPIYSWLLLQGGLDIHNLCVVLNVDNSEKPELQMVFLQKFLKEPQFINESALADIKNCKGPTAIINRKYQDNPLDCLPTCAREAYSFRYCSLQQMKGWASFQGRVLTNRVCLP